MDIAELTRKAHVGSCAAQTTLGLYYLFGYGPVGVNYQQAFQLLSMASEKGASRATVNLGDMYAQGLGVTQDISKAIQLYESVATVEFFAAFELGRIYSRGIGVPSDPEGALRWYSAAVDFEGHIDDCDELAEAKAYVSDSKSINRDGSA